MLKLPSLRPLVAAGLLLGAALVPPQVSASPPSVVTLDPTQKLHPLLQYGAQVDPNRTVRVIVQKTRADIVSSLVTTLVAGLQVNE